MYHLLVNTHLTFMTALLCVDILFNQALGLRKQKGRDWVTLTCPKLVDGNLGSLTEAWFFNHYDFVCFPLYHDFV